MKAVLRMLVPATGLAACFAPSAIGQFWDTPISVSDQVEDLLVTRDGSAFAIVDNKGVYKSADEAATFERVLEGGSFFSLAESSKMVLAAGLNGLWASSDGGDSWSQLLPADAWAVAADGDDIVAGGSASIVFQSVNDGSTWLIPNASAIPFLESSATLAVAVSGAMVAYSTIFSDLTVSTDGGVSWTTTSQLSPDVVYFRGGKFYADNFDEIWTSDDLLNWSQFGSDSDVFWDKIAVNGQVVAVAGMFSGLALSTNEGLSWFDLSTDFGTNRTGAVAFLPDGRLLAGADTLIYRSSSPVEPGSSVSVGKAAAGIDRQLQIEVFPNPSNGPFSISIRTNSPALVRIDVFDILGQRVFREMLDARGGKRIPVRLDGTLPAGTYFVRVVDGQRSASRSITIVH